ncbi:MAG: NFACT RNA binding domain-containing protein, partial [Tissierellia bacterium]|nr:NFACT RNA binding domain-containing protein [Tissierellia bacterium]
QGGVIESVEQFKLDRVISINIRSMDDMGYPCKKRLIIEIMGKHSNIILVDEDDIVIDSIKKVTLDMSRVRQILPGAKYKYIQDEKINLLTENNLPSDLFDFSKSSNVYKAFYMNYTGMSPMIGKEIVYQSNFDIDKKLNTLNSDEIAKLDEVFIKYRDKIRESKFTPVILYDLNKIKMIGFYCMEIEHLGNNFTIYNSISNVLSLYYENHGVDDRLNQMNHNLLKSLNNRIKRYNNKYIALLNDLEEAKDREKYRVYADVLSANIHKIGRGNKTVELENFYSEDMEKIDIPLDIRISPAENAQNYYKRYSKLKKTEFVLNKEIPKLKSEIKYLDQVRHTLSSITELDELDEIKMELMNYGYIKKDKNKNKKKRVKSSKPLKNISSKGNIIYVGKNNKQNDELTLKTANKEDLFFHAQAVPGAHVILKNDSGELDESSIYEAAYLAAKYSSLKDENMVTIDYTSKKNVYKAKGAKPGMVYYNNFKSIVIDLKKPDLQIELKPV